MGRKCAECAFSGNLCELAKRDDPMYMETLQVEMTAMRAMLPLISNQPTARSRDKRSLDREDQAYGISGDKGKVSVRARPRAISISDDEDHVLIKGEPQTISISDDEDEVDVKRESQAENDSSTFDTAVSAGHKMQDTKRSVVKSIGKERRRQMLMLELREIEVRKQLLQLDDEV